jgi:nucleobase:cation symporter-1, NCS1 family
MLSLSFEARATLVDMLDGTDISWIVGLIVPAVLYYVAARHKGAQAPAKLIVPGESAARGAELAGK